MYRGRVWYSGPMSNDTQTITPNPMAMERLRGEAAPAFALVEKKRDVLKATRRKIENLKEQLALCERGLRKAEAEVVLREREIAAMEGLIEETAEVVAKEVYGSEELQRMLTEYWDTPREQRDPERKAEIDGWVAQMQRTTDAVQDLGNRMKKVYYNK